MILRRTEEGALKWALRLLRREEETSVGRYPSASYSQQVSSKSQHLHPTSPVQKLDPLVDIQMERTIREHRGMTNRGCTSS